jgi:asparagine synthase (glutamine-hydrolysing)
MNHRQFEGTSLQVELKGHCGQVTSIGNIFFCVGHVFLNDQSLSVDSLLRLIKQSIFESNFIALLQKLNGFYAFIYYDTDTGIVYAVMDRLRSRPLFYSMHEQKLYLSDSVSWLNAQFSGKSLNVQGQLELIRAGYISGESTLINEVYQIAAGTLFTFHNNTHDLVKYHNFIPKNAHEILSERAQFQQLDSALKKSINRLVSLANGRQIVIPLSGGFDSRIIALYLKQTGYQNIVTFTFGKKNSQEVKFSHRIATGLAFSWHFVEYNRQLWRSEKKSSQFKDFILFISNFTSVPNVQVYPAIKALLTSGVIEQDAIIVPGHTGDFISGGHMPDKLMHIPAQGSTSVVVACIMAKHYRYKNPGQFDRKLVEKISKQIDVLSQDVEQYSPAASLFEAWECNERQAKFIVNSNRYYDFWRLDWWMPLWDNELMTFWEQASLTSRQQSLFWQSFINLKCIEMLGDKAPQGNAAEYFSPFWRRIRSIFDYFSDQNGLYELVPIHRWLLQKIKYPNANGTVFSYLAEQVCKTQKKQIK